MPSINIQVGTKAVFTKEDAVVEPVQQEVKKPRKKRITKKEKEEQEAAAQKDLPMTASNTPYSETYQNTQNMLYGIVDEVAMGCAEISQDLNEIRSSKTARKKYDYIAQLQSTRATMISTRISAIKEINATITKGHDLDLKRSKELKLNNDTDDVKQIQDMYNAFISTPVSQNMQGPYSNPLGPTTPDFTAVNPMLQYSAMGMDMNAGRDEYRQNLSPDAAMMLIGENPNLEEVIVYDSATGASSFEIFDKSNNTILTGVVPTKSNEMFMPSMEFDFNNGVAHSNDLNESYRIVDASTVVGQSGVDSIFNGINKNMNKF